MTTDSFPSDPASRKAIFVLEQHDIEKSAYTGVARQLLDDEVYVLQVPVRNETSSALQHIIASHLARPGCVLIQSPYDPDVYEDVSLAPQRFALEKHVHFMTLCMHLGAREVSVEQLDLHTSTGNSTVDVKGTRLGVGAQLTVENEQLEKLRAQMRLHDEFAGAAPDIAAAERLLKQTGLSFDPVMRGLLEMRRGSANQLIERKLVLSLSSEVKSNLKVLGRINVPAFVKLSVDYKRLVREEHDFTLTVRVRF